MASMLRQYLGVLKFSPTRLQVESRCTYCVKDGLLLVSDEEGWVWQTPAERIGLGDDRVCLRGLEMSTAIYEGDIAIDMTMVPQPVVQLGEQPSAAAAA